MKRVQKIESPCISICKLDSISGFCAGCWRTAEEIKFWQEANYNERLSILSLCRKRKLAIGLRARRKTNRKIKRV